MRICNFMPGRSGPSPDVILLTTGKLGGDGTQSQAYYAWQISVSTIKSAATSLTKSPDFVCTGSILRDIFLALKGKVAGIYRAVYSMCASLSTSTLRTMTQSNFLNTALVLIGHTTAQTTTFYHNLSTHQICRISVTALVTCLPNHQ